MIWNTENHHHYAKDFASYLEGRIKELEGQRPSFEQHIDKKNQRYCLVDSRAIEDYRKVTMLACSRDERYVLSMIGRNLNDCVSTVNEILTGKKSPLDKAKEIAARFGAEYTHLAKFEGQKLVNDLEVVS